MIIYNVIKGKNIYIKYRKSKRERKISILGVKMKVT